VVMAFGPPRLDGWANAGRLQSDKVIDHMPGAGQDNCSRSETDCTRCQVRCELFEKKLLFVPVWSACGGSFQRHTEPHRAFHMADNLGGGSGHVRDWTLKNQLVVNLQEHRKARW